MSRTLRALVGAGALTAGVAVGAGLSAGCGPCGDEVVERVCVDGTPWIEGSRRAVDLDPGDGVVDGLEDESVRFSFDLEGLTIRVHEGDSVHTLWFERGEAVWTEDCDL